MTAKKRPRLSFDSAIVDIWRRELGQLSSTNFANRLAASEDLVIRLDVLRKLDDHSDRVNTLCFNASGDVLVSGSDDGRIILWDWESGRVKHSFHSGHPNNVLQAKMMPYTEDRSIVTSDADGQLRHAHICESKVESKLLAEQDGEVPNLAIEPGSPRVFYTCGVDGLVQHIDLRTERATRLFTCQPLARHTLHRSVYLSAITIDPRNPNLFAVGGSDTFARVYDIRKCKWDGSSEFGQPVNFFCPSHLVNDDSVAITGLAYSSQSELLVSYNDELIYLFAKDIGFGPNLRDSRLSNVEGDIEAAPQSYKGHSNSGAVKGVTFSGPKCEYVVTGSDCGRIFIWNKKGGKLVRVIEAHRLDVNCVETHPHATVLASTGIENVIKMWIPKAIDESIQPTNIDEERVLNLSPLLGSLYGFSDNSDNDDEFVCSDTDDDSKEDDGDGEDDDEDDGDGEDNDDEDEDDEDDSNGEDDDDEDEEDVDDNDEDDGNGEDDDDEDEEDIDDNDEDDGNGEDDDDEDEEDIDDEDEDDEDEDE